MHREQDRRIEIEEEALRGRIRQAIINPMDSTRFMFDCMQGEHNPPKVL